MSSPDAPPLLLVEGVARDFKADDRRVIRALETVSLEVRAQEFLAIVGPSGCGKSTLLQIMAGLMMPTAGRVAVNGRPVVAPPPEAVYVFQQYTKSLLPWRTVRQNVEFPLEHRRELGRAARRDRCQRALAQVGLEEFAAHYPWQLSGGMQQRLALARALVAQPALLLMDEPFSSVDALTRMELQDLVLDTWERQKLTVVFVTHDVDEAIYLSDRVVAMTARPARIAHTLVTDLARPREQIATRALPRFLQLRQELYEIVAGQRARRSRG
jgi:NitT/TauT family transport system ATP-binding protein